MFPRHWYWFLPNWTGLVRKKHVVALIVESSTNYGRQLLRGVLRFKKTQSNWSVFLEQRDLKAGPPSWLPDWTGDGIICRSTTPEIAAVIRRRKIPFIELTDRRDEMLEFVTLRSDDAAIGRLGAEHLLERGFRNFGFGGFHAEAWSDRRQASFVEQLEQKGLSCSIFKSGWYGSSQGKASARTLENDQRRLGDWIESLPKPVGIMACNDICGKQILDSLHVARTGSSREGCGLWALTMTKSSVIFASHCCQVLCPTPN